MTLILKTFFSGFLVMFTLFGCSDEETSPKPVNDAGSDVTTEQDATTIPDGGMDGGMNSGDDAGDGTTNILDTWDTYGACTIDSISGPIIVFMERTDPVGCVQVVFEKSEEPSDFELMVDSGWITSAVLVEDTSCTPATLVEFANGLSATEATGSADLSLEGLGIPEALNSASFELTFPEGPENPFGPFVGVLEVSQSIILQKCDP